MNGPISITGTVVGAEQVITRLSVTAPQQSLERMRATVRMLGYELERNIKTDWLTGRALKRRTGRLARSINTRFTSTGTSETASVGTNVSYARIWEVTGSKAFMIYPKNKKALFWPGARHPVKSVMHPAQAPRPFLKPALNEMRPRIHDQLAAAMRGL